MRNRRGGGVLASASNKAPHALRQWIVSGRSNWWASLRCSAKTSAWTAREGAETHESRPHSPTDARGWDSSRIASRCCQPALAVWACHGWIPNAGETKSGWVRARVSTWGQSDSRVAFTTQRSMPACFMAAMMGADSPRRGSWRWLWASVHCGTARAGSGGDDASGDMARRLPVC